MTMEELRGAVARGWCHPENESKEMDADLAEAIAREVWDALNPPNLGCATTRELLVELTARTEVDGSALYRTVDGGRDHRALQAMFTTTPDDDSREATDV